MEPVSLTNTMASDSECEDIDVDHPGAEDHQSDDDNVDEDSSDITISKKGRRVWERKYEEITLEEALMFEDDTWCAKFFGSLDEMHQLYPERLLFLEWWVDKEKLGDSIIQWKVIAGSRTYPAKLTNDFGRRLKNGYEPVMFEDKKREDIVMVSPGKGNGTGYEGGFGGKLREGRCKHLLNFMCSGGTGEKEKKDLWRMVGETALKRIKGELKRKNGRNKNQVAQMDAEGHDKVLISTHGFGVGWLHVRIESNPKYPDVANL